MQDAFYIFDYYLEVFKIKTPYGTTGSHKVDLLDISLLSKKYKHIYFIDTYRGNITTEQRKNLFKRFSRFYQLEKKEKTSPMVEVSHFTRNSSLP